ncbi:MAG: universal stress protein [Syntrophobacteraceae bacterium]|nr:universal stress protein [Syntrophobacteraceae bacterium]
MLCYDGSEEAEQGVIEAEKRARAFNGEVLVVTSHVNDDQFYPKRIEPTERSLKQVQAFFDKNGTSCQTLLAYRDFDENKGLHLLALAQQHKVDEIVVGIRSRSKVGKLLLGSIAQLLLLQAECPVLGVKKRQKCDFAG